MCGICGCDDHHHHHDHHELAHEISIEQDVLAKNRQYAQQNAHWLSDKACVAVNLMSSPGSGKTTLLAQTIAKRQSQQEVFVIVGDQETSEDADYITAHGGHALQINTGHVCHLDAHMVGHALLDAPIKSGSLIFIENIGNLVCPALFDLGERFKVVILSVTEGDNKPLKYPDMFRQADLILITKADLLPYVDFDVARCMEHARKVNPAVPFILLSAKQGDGMNEWFNWLDEHCGCL